MKHLAPLMALLIWAHHASFAAPIKTLCLDGESGALFPILDDVPEAGTLDEQRIPEIQYNDSGTAISVQWIEKPKDVICKSEVIGRYKDHEIIDLTFIGHQANFDYPNAPFYSKVLAYRLSTGVSSPLRPFLILGGDNIRWFEQDFESNEKFPFTLNISITIPGNGVMWSNYIFAFSDRGPFLKFHSEGGRKMKTKETTYDFDGKIIDTSTTDEN